MKSCPICGRGTLTPLFQADCIMFPERFSIGECSCCHAQAVMDPPADLSKYYANTHMRQTRNPVYAFFKNILLKRELGRILDGLKSVPPAFIDIGCGVGEFSKLIFDRGYPVFAVDSADQKPPAVAADPVPYLTIDYATGAVAGLPKVQGGVVILRHVLEHVASPEDFVRSLIAQGAGAFYILVPNHDTTEARWLKQYYCFCDPPRHLWHFNAQALDAFFTRLGLTIKARGFDTIPSLVPSLYRSVSLKGWPRPVCSLFDPQGVISTLSLPVNRLLPNNVVWVLVQVP